MEILTTPTSNSVFTPDVACTSPLKTRGLRHPPLTSPWSPPAHGRLADWAFRHVGHGFQLRVQSSNHDSEGMSYALATLPFAELDLVKLYVVAVAPR
ncbi:hypothetical protein LINGRAHAP2_LOCUS23554 [Linum grandiflorum]